MSENQNILKENKINELLLINNNNNNSNINDNILNESLNETFKAELLLLQTNNFELTEQLTNKQTQITELTNNNNRKLLSYLLNCLFVYLFV